MEYTEITYTWEDNSLQQNEDQREMMHECMNACGFFALIPRASSQ